jgi:hypothetical protein
MSILPPTGPVPPGGFTELLERPFLERRAEKALPPPLETFAGSQRYRKSAPSPSLTASLTSEAPRARVLTGAGHDPADPVWKAAKEFEALMLSEMFTHMFSGIKSDGLFGGGHAEETYRTFLMQSYGESVAENGGIGLAEAVYRDIARTYGGGGRGEDQTS